MDVRVLYLRGVLDGLGVGVWVVGGTDYGARVDHGELLFKCGGYEVKLSWFRGNGIKAAIKESGGWGDE